MSASSGAITATQLYSPYGSVRYTSGTLPTSYGYTGQRADAATGLDDYNARSYDPVAGQFTSADTALAGGLNRYAYVGGNPETFVDPTGNHAQSCDLALCGGEGINLDGSLSSAQGGAPGDTSGSGGSSGSRGAGSGESTGETQASASTTTDSVESDGMLAGETFSIDPEGVGTPQGLETGEQYHQEEIHRADTNESNSGTGSQHDSGKGTVPSSAMQGNHNQVHATPSGITVPEPPSPDDLVDGGTVIVGGGRSGGKAQNYGPPNSYVRTSGGHLWVYDENGYRTWDISSERAKPIWWNQAPDGTMYPRDSREHLNVPDVWLYLLLGD